MIRLLQLGLFQIAILCNVVQAEGQSLKKYSLYYLCIASAHYTTDFTKYSKGFNGLLNVEEALYSAQKMDTLFRSWGAKYGKVVQSSKTNFITSRRINVAIAELLGRIQKDGSANPFIIFYYCGHGFSSKKLEALFIPPGDFVQNPETLTLEKWNQLGISPLDIAEKFEKGKIPFMMFLDCCYSGKQESPERLELATVKSFGLEAMDKLMGETYSIFTSMFRMVGPNPVFFSTPAGNAVETVPFTANDSINYSGPLCRRAFAAFELLGEKKSFSVKDLATRFLDPELDPLTRSATSYWVPDENNSNLLMRK